MSECNNVQLVFDSVLEPELLKKKLNIPTAQSQEDKYFRECFTLIGANKLLREQVADADSMIEEILCSLNYGPDNEFVRQAIDIYNQKWYGGR